MIRFNLLSTNIVAHEETNTIDYYFQWARSTNNQATISIYTDDDFNPWNGNEHWVRDFVAAGTTGSDIMHRSPRLVPNASNTPPGIHSLFAKLSANGRSRYLYAPEVFTAMSSFAPPQLSITRQTSTNVNVRVTGRVGQRVVLESGSDLSAWMPLRPIGSRHRIGITWSPREAGALGFFAPPYGRPVGFSPERP